MRRTFFLSVMLAAGAVLSVAQARFGTNTRVDNQNGLLWQCRDPDIVVVQQEPLPWVLCTFSRNSGPSVFSEAGEVMFTMSTDGGQTWTLDGTVARCPGNSDPIPHVDVDPWGRIFITWTDSGLVKLCWSDDNGGSWSEQVRVTSRLGAQPGDCQFDVRDSGVFVVWTDERIGGRNVILGRSLDRGESFPENRFVTWGPGEHYHARVCVDPAREGVVYAAFEALTTPPSIGLARSTDCGMTFEGLESPDSGFGYVSEAELAADSHRFYVMFTGRPTTGWSSTWLRASSDGGQTFGPQRLVGAPTPALLSASDGARVAADGRGGVHACLQLRDTIGSYHDIYYVQSRDSGNTFTLPERVNIDTTHLQERSDLAVDRAGNAYIVWQDWSVYSRIWFATNNPLVGINGASGEARSLTGATICRGILPMTGSVGAELLDVAGRKVMELQRGPNDIRQLAPGIYFVTPSPYPSGAAPGFAKPPEGERTKERGVRSAGSGTRPAVSVRKVVVQR